MHLFVIDTAVIPFFHPHNTPFLSVTNINTHALTRYPIKIMRYDSQCVNILISLRMASFKLEQSPRGITNMRVNVCRGFGAIRGT